MSGGNGPARWGRLTDNGNGGFKWEKAEDPYASQVKYQNELIKAKNDLTGAKGGYAAQYGDKVRVMDAQGNETWRAMDRNGNWNYTQTPDSQLFMNEFSRAKTDTQRQVALKNMRTRRDNAGARPLRNNTGTMFFGNADMAAKFRNSPAYANLQRSLQPPARPPIQQMYGGPIALRGPGKPVRNPGFRGGPRGGRRLG